MNVTKTGIINDLHIPMHDPGSVELSLKVFNQVQINRLIINGDLLDFYAVNMHQKNKHPDVNLKIEEEIESGLNFLDHIDQRFPDIEKILLFGNHEHRLERYVVDKAPGLLNYMRLQNLLNIEGRGWEWLDYQQVYRLEETNLFVMHSPPSYSENAAMTSLKKKPDMSFFYGCTHRMDYAIKTGHNNNYEVFCNGWLGSTNLTERHRKVFSYTKNHQNWQRCFALVYVIDGKEYIANQHRIHSRGEKRFCVVENNYFEV